MESGAGKNTDIEVLRAVAISLALMQHALDQLVLRRSMPEFVTFIDELRIGTAGVDLFFAISGFVIANSLLPRLPASAPLRTQFFESLVFWVRRAFRLLPTATLWLIIVLALTAFMPFSIPQLDFNTNVEATLAGVFYYANFRFAECFNLSEPYGATFQFWTLSFEEQFYFLLPFVVMFSRRHLGWALVAIIIFDQFRPIGVETAVTRMSSLAFGVLLSIWSRQASFAAVRSLFAKAPLIGVPIALLAIAGAILAAKLPPMQYKWGMVGVCVATAVLIASLDLRALTPPKPISSVLLWMGSRSYAIYVVHMPLFLMVKDLWGKANLNQSIVLPLATFAVLFILAELNYRFVELPLRAYGGRVSARMRAPKQVSTQTA